MNCFTLYVWFRHNITSHCLLYNVKMSCNENVWLIKLHTFYNMNKFIKYNSSINTILSIFHEINTLYFISAANNWNKCSVIVIITTKIRQIMPKWFRVRYIAIKTLKGTHSGLTSVFVYIYEEINTILAPVGLLNTSY